MKSLKEKGEKEKMNKAEWTDFFFYIKELFRITKKRKVEKALESSKSNKDNDTFSKNNKETRYAKKSRKNYDI